MLWWASKIFQHKVYLSLSLALPQFTSEPNPTHHDTEGNKNRHYTHWDGRKEGGTVKSGRAPCPKGAGGKKQGRARSESATAI